MELGSRGGFNTPCSGLDPVSCPWSMYGRLTSHGVELEKHKLLHARLETALRNDKSFQALYFTVLHLFVDRLRADLEALGKHNDFARVTAEEGKPSPEGSPHLFGMSYAAKWLPTPAHGADKQLHFATAVGVLLFPGAGVEGSRIMLQSKVLSPLRKVLRVPEVQFGQGTWNIDYRRVSIWPTSSLQETCSRLIRFPPMPCRATPHCSWPKTPLAMEHIWIRLPRGRS